MARPDLHAPLAPGETIVGRWVAGLPALGGRGVKVGGTLFLTTARLVWQPVGPPVAVQLLTGVGGFDDLMRGMRLARLAAVRPDPQRKALLHLTTIDGDDLSLMIAASAGTPVWSGRNRIARDAAVAAIEEARRQSG